MRAAMMMLVLAACGGPASHPVTLVNQTPRTIAEVFAFPPGASHGASRGRLPPGASLVIRVRAGNVEFLAISEKVKVNQTESETKQASSTIQLVRPIQLIFHDSDQPAPAAGGLNKDQIGVAFRVTKEAPAPEPDAP